ncbi:MPN555 family protein chaperone [Mycoplasma bradburyae]|uniref:Trigger factor C-terminal domain-containing protein n=1 Tax=Mycoplasma bradburyae TaxID=2963128 RepID=A0AAW6HSF5_9MOLU|nr:hypothetical protein [Mycoplasma bradburyae]MDC4163552.1 hypothetical protein [Mycoplasma bradburyae]MDC4182150.1 hypothetical protein [Mycoplasma bradburyae]MDC4182915.1 hypothetical protein [Mycoplasma bradburyae]MDC4183598.1 hypothetical protein [Mycoplasma bradburyae]MDC4184336.1 hypothetical protein [Mycoplasma bradburyae]
MSSKLKLKKDIDYSTEITVSQFFIDPAMLQQQRERIKAALPKEMSDESIMQYELLQLTIKDNLFSAIMNYLADHFEFEMSEEQMKSVIEQLKLSGVNADENILKNMADKIIKKGLMFDHFAKEWNVKVTDEEVKNMLDAYYEKTNQSIHDVLNDKNKFESVRVSILEEKMVMKTISKFALRFNLQNPNYQEESSDSDKSVN